MELLPEQLRNQIPKFQTTEQDDMGEIPVIVKYFTPDSNWTWYVTEGEAEDDDFIFFGLVDGFEKEWGYFALSELISLRGPLGLPVERDLHFTNKKIKDIT